MHERNMNRMATKNGSSYLDLDSPKGRIVAAALKLFACAGYNAVSVRDIAREVGIRDASIYSHFESKDAILEAIIGRFNAVFNASVPAIGEFDEIFRHCDPRGFFRKGIELFRKRVEEPVMAQTYLVLIRERLDDERAKSAWMAHREQCVRYVAEAIAAMARKGMVDGRDPVVLARLYEYPVFMMIEDYVARRCRGETTDAVVDELLAHSDCFAGMIEKKERERL
jgi:AcrR family transcriptional regulator